ncbi:MAG: TonB-dependent receptor [Bacteroidota bacterium]|nr:TonB-dependent receptor [Bacteroidota bacterium]
MQQQKSVSGKVTDSTGEGLPGVSVVVKDTTNGSITDTNGNYSISNIPENAILVFSFIGMKTQEISVGSKTKVNVILAEFTIGIDEVVAIGYGTVKKSDLTGSVAIVKAEGLSTIPVASIGDALQGQAAGVQVISSGVPGADPTFNIRGIGTINESRPLYVIDGVPVSMGLNHLNMNDVESIQILKDASATAIYGSRGANGVIIITTKRGKAGQGQLNFNYYFGFQEAAKVVKELNASQFAVLHNEIMENAGLMKNPAFANPESLGAGTNWLDALYRTASMKNYSFSYSGNNEKTNYYVSGNVFDQEGIVINTGFTRYTIQLNTDTEISKRIRFGNNLTLEHDLRKSGNYNIQNTMLALPTQPIFRSEDSYSGPLGQPIWNGDIVNPIGLSKTVENSSKGYNLLGAVYGEVEIIEALKFRTSLGLQANFGDDRTWSPAYEWDTSIDENSSLYHQSGKSITWLWDNTLTYDKVFGVNHHLTLMAGTSAQENRYDFTNGSAQDFQSNETQQLSNATNILTLNGNAYEWSLMSYMGRANYIFADKYLLTATIRRDGSSRFGEGNRWGWFPSGSFAWRISKEKFFENIHFMNDMKLRIGYGVTGNQEIGNYSFASVLETYQYNFNGKPVSAVVPNVMPNTDVQWENQKQGNIGLDMTFLKNRVNLTVDGYIKNTDRMLVPMSVPVTSGYSDQDVSYTNAGKLRNRGLEISAQTRNLTGAFRWNTSFNVSLNQNKILSLNDSIPISRGRLGENYNLVLLQAGQPVNEFYGFVTDGIFQTQKEVDNHATQVAGNDPYNRTSPGDIRFKDLNNDGVIDDKDRTFIGNPSPKCFFAMTNTFAYKGFDLSIFLQGIVGNKIVNANRIWSEAMSVAQNQTTETLKRWSGEGTSNTVPRAIYNDPNNNERFSDRYIESGSYLRIKNVTFGYTLPEMLIEKINSSKIRIYVSVQNLQTFSNYKGFDPEVAQDGIDNNLYPVSRTISCGVNLNF